MKTKTTIAVVLALTLGLVYFSGSSEAWAQGSLLYTVTNANQLAAVDVNVVPLASGTTIIGVTRDAVSPFTVRRIRGLAYDAGHNIMYGMTREGDLVTVNLGNGATTFLFAVSPHGSPPNFWSGLAFDGNKTLYTTNAFGLNELVKIVLSPSSITATFQGSTIFLGSIYLQILGLDFYPSSAPQCPPPPSAPCPPTFNGTHPAPHVLYGSNRNNDNIVVVDAGTGVVTMPMGSHTVGVNNLQEIAFHPQTGSLYAIHDHYSLSNNAALSTYNFTTEMSTELGELPFGIVDNNSYGFGGLAFAPNQCVPPPTDMVAWYPFDETTGTSAADRSGNNNPGTLINGPTHISGKVAGGLNFDGINDYVQALNIPPTNFGPAGAPPSCTAGPCLGDFSIDAWIRLQPGAPNSVMTIVDKRDTATGVGYHLFLSFKRLGLQLADGGVPFFTNYVSVAQASLTDGNWHHIAVTVDRRKGASTTQGQITWYFDGATILPQGSDNPTNHLLSLSNTAPLRIGTLTFGGPSAYFQGDMDELEIFNRELSATEVKAIFDAQYFGKCKH